MKTRKPVDYFDQDYVLLASKSFDEMERHCFAMIRALKKVHEQELAPYLDALVKISAMRPGSSPAPRAHLPEDPLR